MQADAPVRTEDLPPVYRADLDPETLDALFADVAAHADLLGCVLKGGAEEYADGVCPLGRAHDLLSTRAVRGVQLRYRHDGNEWWDTLISADPDTVRLVRIRHEV
ncbi:MAG: hypothetical protein ACQEXJ_19185 [Myxococcota bacterium]